MSECSRCHHAKWLHIPEKLTMPETAVMRDQKAPCKKCGCPDYIERRLGGME